jgi:hypothetical protein
VARERRALLVNEADAVIESVLGSMTVEITIVTIDRDGPSIGADDAGENLDQGRFARSVAAKQRMDLPCIDRDSSSR